MTRQRERSVVEKRAGLALFLGAKRRRRAEAPKRGPNVRPDRDTLSRKKEEEEEGEEAGS